MAVIQVPANGTAVEVIATTAKGIIQVNQGNVRAGIAATPSDGLRLSAGQVISVDGWTGAWSVVTAVPGVAASVIVETE